MKASMPTEMHGRLGSGVVLEAQVIWACRVADVPGHLKTRQKIQSLAESGQSLVVAYLSLAEAARRIQEGFGSPAMVEMLREARETFNIILPNQDDIEAAEEALSRGLEKLTLEQAIAAAVAKRLGCSIYGNSPAYHFWRIPVIIDS